jgi:uncharacterized membrane protein YeiB
MKGGSRLLRKLMSIKFRLLHSLFLNRGDSIFKYAVAGFYVFFAKPTRMGNTVRGDGQLFFMYAGDKWKLIGK